jgi:hypothetical protein
MLLSMPCLRMQVDALVKQPRHSWLTLEIVTKQQCVLVCLQTQGWCTVSKLMFHARSMHP